MLRLVYWMVHLTALCSALGLHGAGTARLIVRVIMLQVHCVSTHTWLGLIDLHVSIKLVILLHLVAGRGGHMVLLMISAGSKLTDWCTSVLTIVSIRVLWLFAFQIIVRQVTYLILKLLVLALRWVRPVVVHVLTADNVVRILNEVVSSNRVRCVLRCRSHLLLILISLDILAVRVILLVLHPSFLIWIFALSLIGVLTSRWEGHLLR